MYNPPIASYEFMLTQTGLGARILKLAKEEAAYDLDDILAILNEAGRFASEQIATINQEGDHIGAVLENGQVRLPPSFVQAFADYNAAGWTGLAFSQKHGGQDLPWTLAASVIEMFQAANLAWGLNPLLTIGAAEAIDHHGSESQKMKYMKNLVVGKWSGTMNLTEAQAGSDLGKIKTSAKFSHETDGTKYYRIKGQKIFITYGDNDAYENIIHMVLARVEGAPEGVKGISLFIVPKFLPNEDGTLGKHNDVKPIALEKKLGIHGSPTCVMAYGEDEGALGELVGVEHHGLAYMFTMMNLARIMVAIQGLGISDRAYQQALSYANERRQGKHKDQDFVPIIQHSDVRRMLADMQCQILAMRASLMDVMLAFDTSRSDSDQGWREFAQRRVDLMVPVLKAWFTDQGVEIASKALQVHGGAGFIEETGAAQHYRDARILPIYEGTNGIQAMDLIGRKILKDEGKAAFEFLEEANSLINHMNRHEEEEIVIIRKYMASAIDALDESVDFVIEIGADKQQATQDILGVVAHDLNHLFAIVTGGVSLCNLLLEAMQKQQDTAQQDDFAKQKLTDFLNSARYYAESVMIMAPALAAKIQRNPNGLMKVNFKND